MHFQQATIRLTGLYVLILMTLSIACSAWLYNAAGSEINSVTQHLPPQGTSYQGVVYAEGSKKRLVQSLGFFNLFTLGAGTLASYVLARRTLRPIQLGYEAQAQFAADASHELRTPLTALRAELQLAQQKGVPTPAAYKALLTSSLEEVDRLTSLTERLLRLTSTSSGPGGNVANLHNALGSMQKTLAKSIDEKQIRIVLPVQDQRLAIHIDDLIELLTIVLDNAVKYSPAKTTVTISASQVRGQVEVRVADEGAGIAPEDLPYIFERFHRGNQAVATKGYGLGLAVAKKLVASVNGSIKAESKLGHGTTIIFKIPTAISA